MFNTNTVVFILDTNDIDSYIAYEYASIHLKDKLTHLVIDGKPNAKNKPLLNNLTIFLQKQAVLGVSNIEISTKLPFSIYTVICCSTLNKVV